MTDTSNGSASDATIAALRAADKPGDDQVAAVAAAITPAEARNAPRFNLHTQAVAGVLMAKEEEFKRVDMELADRSEAAAAIYNASVDNAEAAYKAAIAAAEAAHTAAQNQITDEMNDLAIARSGIRKTLAALS